MIILPKGFVGVRIDADTNAGHSSFSSVFGFCIDKMIKSKGVHVKVLPGLSRGAFIKEMSQMSTLQALKESIARIRTKQRAYDTLMIREAFANVPIAKSSNWRTWRRRFLASEFIVLIQSDQET